jgi:hypothetical protein
MLVKSFDFDINAGFAWIVVDGKKEGDEWTVQCCLSPEKNFMKKVDAGKSYRYVKKIDGGDCGHNEGICGDVNGQAFEHWGENRCITALFHHAKKAGIVVI